MYVFLAAAGLCCFWGGVSLVVASEELLFVVRGLLTVEASLL